MCVADFYEKLKNTGLLDNCEHRYNFTGIIWVSVNIGIGNRTMNLDKVKFIMLFAKLCDFVAVSKERPNKNEVMNIYLIPDDYFR